MTALTLMGRQHNIVYFHWRHRAINEVAYLFSAWRSGSFHMKRCMACAIYVFWLPCSSRNPNIRSIATAQAMIINITYRLNVYYISLRIGIQSQCHQAFHARYARYYHRSNSVWAMHIREVVIDAASSLAIIIKNYRAADKPNNVYYWRWKPGNHCRLLRFCRHMPEAIIASSAYSRHECLLRHNTGISIRIIRIRYLDGMIAIICFATAVE